jgi:AraC-like DNA-binding protein
MAIKVETLAEGRGWRVHDVVCDSGPRDKSFIEQHDGYSIAAVTHGSFQYRGSTGAATLVPGSFLLGNHRACFECGHEHARGDRCLSFRFTPGYFECLMDGAESHAKNFSRASLPPIPEMARLFADAELARDERDAPALEEISVRLAGAVATVLAPPRHSIRRPTARHERRITEAVRRIEQNAHEPWTLTRLASDAAMSPYHFLHTFRRVTGITPHQFVLHTRLRRAAKQLRQSGEQIATIAIDAGFNDLATFNRRFRRLMGTTPSAYRALGTSH